MPNKKSNPLPNMDCGRGEERGSEKISDPKAPEITNRAGVFLGFLCTMAESAIFPVK